MKKKVRKHKFRNTVGIVLLLVLCIGGAELTATYWLDRPLFDKITQPIIHKAQDLIEIGGEKLAASKAWVSDKMEEAAQKVAEEAEEKAAAEAAMVQEEIESQEAREPLLTDGGEAITDPTITELVIENGQEILTGGSISINYYAQSDPAWKSKSYGSDSIGGYGCGPTVMAMAVKSLTDIQTDPEKMAQWCVAKGYWAAKSGSYHSMVRGVAEGYGLHCVQPTALSADGLRMQLSGGKAFSQLRDKLDATLTVDYRGEELPLSAVRALAYDSDAAVRKEAYEAELASYKKIELPMSFCLNNIKAEGQTMAELKGYKDVLEMTLAESRMTRKTLDAMWTAIREALPELREYFKAKGRLLGHENGLPFYDLFAPIGESTKKYTIEEARDTLLDIFGHFCPEMGKMMATAFDEGWIDMYPKAGKSGGAFCAGCYDLDISRVLTNFTGSLSDISTLAHELGHAFNNKMLRRKPYLMTSVPMPLAETASTFNETVFAAEMREKASREEELMLLDASLMENSQTMVDIYSRFLFEQKVVDAQADHALSADELKETMLWAQDQSYGDGLDPKFRHPYMWACKSHYYSTGTHFYNFPYAFGGLFARGLYARYEQEGEAFVPVYCDLLSRFGSGTIEDVTASVGIDVTTPEFWRSAVGSVLEEVRRFVELANG